MAEFIDTWEPYRAVAGSTVDLSVEERRAVLWAIRLALKTPGRSELLDAYSEATLRSAGHKIEMGGPAI
jgi:hypothetical protein